MTRFRLLSGLEVSRLDPFALRRLPRPRALRGSAACRGRGPSPGDAGHRGHGPGAGDTEPPSARGAAAEVEDFGALSGVRVRFRGVHGKWPQQNIYLGFISTIEDGTMT